jgi:hypothetical protein
MGQTGSVVAEVVCPVCVCLLWVFSVVGGCGKWFVPLFGGLMEDGEGEEEPRYTRCRSDFF